MARFDYMQSVNITQKDFSFAGIIMAAMRKADSTNIEKLKAAWPEIWKELQARYNAPNAWLPGEINDEGEVVRGK